MSLFMSSGLLKEDNTLEGVLALLNSKSGCIKIYTGPSPRTADEATTGTCLCTFKRDGKALRFDKKGSFIVLRPRVIPCMTFLKRLKLAVKSYFLLLKTPTVNYIYGITGIAEEAGRANYFRFVFESDTGEKSSEAVRIQGSVKYSGGDLCLSRIDLMKGQTNIIDFFEITHNSWC